MRILKPLPGSLPLPERNIVGDWPMWEGSGISVADQSLNKNTGTMVGTAPSWTRDKFGHAVNFPGLDQYIIIASRTYNLVGRGTTFAFWANPQTNVTNLVMGGNQNTHQFLFFSAADDSLRIETNTNGDLGISNPMVLDGNLHHFALSVAYGTVQAYQDGAPVAMFDNTVVDNVTFQRIGSSPTPFYFTGIIDHLLIFDFALFPSEIARLYRESFYRYPENRCFAVA